MNIRNPNKISNSYELIQEAVQASLPDVDTFAVTLPDRLTVGLMESAPQLVDHFKETLSNTGRDHYFYHFTLAIKLEYLKSELLKRAYSREHIETISQTLQVMACILILNSSYRTLALPALTYVMKTYTGMQHAHASILANATLWGVTKLVTVNAPGQFNMYDFVKNAAHVLTAAVGRCSAEAFFANGVKIYRRGSKWLSGFSIFSANAEVIPVEELQRQEQPGL